MSSRVAGIASTSTAPTLARPAATASGVVCVGVNETSARFSCFVGPQRPPKSAVVSFSGANAVLGVASVRDKPSKAAKGSLAVEGGARAAAFYGERPLRGLRRFIPHRGDTEYGVRPGEADDGGLWRPLGSHKTREARRGLVNANADDARRGCRGPRQ